MPRPPDIQVIAPNLKRRLSGVTATIARLVPVQAREIGIVATGPGLPDAVPHLSLFRVLTLPRGPRRVWHARRNIEMLLGLFLRDMLRKDLALLFTSASQRSHTGYSRWLISRMDRIVATSARTAAYLERPARVIHHGIDTDRFKPASDKAALRRRLDLPDGPLIGCFGRIRAQKGTDVFVDAVIAVAETRPDVHAVVLGRATEKHQAFLADLKARVSRAGLADRIHFRAEVPVDRVPDWYAALDVFVAPQRWEGFGLTPLEAMAAGVPVVATRVGAFEELVDDPATGRLIDAGDIPAMVAAVGQVLADARTMGVAARTRVADGFTLAAEAQALIEVYRELLSSSAQS